ncbi:MAG: SLC13 family permease [Candidatus Bathyarchaeia archaeon]
MNRGNLIKIIGAVLGISVALIVSLMPTPAGFNQLGQAVLGITLMTAIFWATGPISLGSATVLMLALYALVGVPATTAFSAFTSATAWVLIPGLLYGFAMAKTGLGKRIAWSLIRISKPTYPSIMLTFLALGFAFSLVIPSFTARVALIAPIAWAIVKAMKVEECSDGCALLTLGSMILVVVPGLAFLTGTLYGPMLIGYLPAAEAAKVTWLGWFTTFGVPFVLFSILTYFGLILVFKPKQPLSISPSMVKDEMAKLGPMTRSEKYLLAIFVLSIVGWIAQSLPGMSWFGAQYTAMLGLAALFATRVLSPPDFSGIPWDLAIFIIGAVSLGTVISYPTAGVGTFLGNIIGPALLPIAANILIFAPLFFILVFLFNAVAAMLPLVIVFLASLLPQMMGLGYTPYIIYAIALAAWPMTFFKWSFYPVAMVEGFTGGKGFKMSHQLKLGAVVLVMALISLLVGVLYWQMTGLFPAKTL